MVRHVIRNAALAAMISVSVAFGCEEETAVQKTALSTMIPDPVPVALGLATGSMIFDFSAHPLDLTRQYDLEMVLFTGGIGLTVTNDGTGVACNLTQGTAVMTTPDDDGEYLVTSSADGKTVTVVFYNSLFGGHIVAGGDYSAAVEVLENEFFATETFNRDVTVTQ